MQKTLGVTADGVWGKKTDLAYKKLTSGGGNARASADDTASLLKDTYEEVTASGLSMGEKAEAIAMLAALEKYGYPDYIRRTLLGIRMAGGAEAFFKNPAGPSRDAVAEILQGQYKSLEEELAQTLRETAKTPIWERWLSPGGQYRELLARQDDIQEQMSILEKRLDRLDPDWQGKLYLVDWDEVDAWAKAQEEEETREEGEEIPDEETPENEEDQNQPSKEHPQERKLIKDLSISPEVIKVFIDREGNEPYLRATGIGLFDKSGKLIGIYPHYVNDGGITLGYGHRITKVALKLEPYQAALYNQYTPGAAFDGPKGKIQGGIPMSIKEANELLLKDIEVYKSRLIRGLKKYDAKKGPNVMLTQQEFDALMLVSFNEGNVGDIYNLLVDNNHDRDDWAKKWNEGEREEIALDIFFDGDYEARRK